MAVNPKLLSRVGSYLRGGPTEREESRTAVLQEVEDDLAGEGYGVNEALDPGSLVPLNSDEKRDAVVSKHEDNDNYEAWSPKGDPWSYELIAGESASESYIIATNAAGKEFKVHASSKPEMFKAILVTSPSAMKAGFGREEVTSAAAAPAPAPAPASAVPDYESMSGTPARDNYVESDSGYGMSEQKPSYGESEKEPYGESDPEDVEKSDPFAAGKQINSAAGKAYSAAGGVGQDVLARDAKKRTKS